MSELDAFINRFNVKHIQSIRGPTNYANFGYHQKASYYADREELVEMEISRAGFEQLVKLDGAYAKLWQDESDERYLRNQVYTPNEVRILKGMNPIEGGDKVVDLQAQAAEIKAQAMNSRERTQQRDANSPDKSGEARNPKGEGRVTA